MLAGTLLATTIQTRAQTKIGGSGAPDSSAMLEVTGGTGNNKGLLLPRVSLANISTWGLNGSTPVAGMLVYNTNVSVAGGSGVGTYYWNGTQWVKSASNSGWNLTGNAGTDSANNFIGTTDARPLVLRTANNEKLRITTSGNVGIGVAAPTAQLQLANSLQPRKLVLWDGAPGNPNRFFGLGVEPLRMRYQVNNTGDDHVFFSGTTDSSSLELMRIKGNGNVGIGTATPGAKMAVEGAFGAFGGLSLTNSTNSSGITITPGYDMTTPAAGMVTFDMPLTGNFVFGDHIVPSGAMQLGLTNRRWAGVNTQTLDADGIGRIGGSVPSNTITSITGRDATGNIGNITLGSGINLAAGVLSVPTPSVELLKGILVADGVNIGDTTTGWLNTGATITIPANSTYVVTADMILSTVAIGSPGGSSFVPAGQSLWVRSSFADAPTAGPSADLVGNNDLISGTISAGMIYNMLHGAVTISNTTNAPKTYYYIVGNVVNNGFTPTLYGLGATQWAENQIYAIPIN